MPFVGTESNGGLSTAGARAGLERTWTFDGGIGGTVRGYPLRTLGMNGVQVIVNQTAGLLATVRVQAILTDFSNVAGDVGWYTLTTTNITALGVPEVILLSPIIAHHVRVRIDVSNGNATGTYLVGAIHT